MPAAAANFDIKPIRIVLDEKVKLEKLTITNVSDTEFPIQIRGYEWSQNEKGEDVYSETKDIIIFPKILSIKQGEERIIRIGTSIRPEAREKTYRLYVEEMPLPETEKAGANIRLFMKVGIPVFINPVKIENHAEIEDMAVVNGKLKVKVRNQGNSHFMVTGVTVRGETNEGKERFARDMGGWYLLNGSRKTYETDVPADVCGAISHLNVEVKTSKVTVKKSIAMDKTMCGQGDRLACVQGDQAGCRQVGMIYSY
jgi:fimbrial chaperone protein